MIVPRILIGALVGFELLNIAGVLNFTLDFSWLGLLVTSVGTFIVIETAYHVFRRRNIFLSPSPYSLAVAGLWLDALGDILHWYARFGWYDQFMHFAGGVIVMTISLVIFSKIQKKFSLPLFAVLLFSLAFVSLSGTLYETEEYLEDRFYHGHQLRLGDGPDTADDLMWNLAGGLGVGAIYLIARKQKESRR